MYAALHTKVSGESNHQEFIINVKGDLVTCSDFRLHTTHVNVHFEVLAGYRGYRIYPGFLELSGPGSVEERQKLQQASMCMNDDTSKADIHRALAGCE